MVLNQNWCFTVNNPTQPYPILNDTIKYLVYQLERGEQGTPHLQGYLQTYSRTSRRKLLNFLPQGTHLEPRRGTHQQAKEYCTKTESRVSGPWEYGIETTKRGQRTDLEQIKLSIQEGADETSIAEEYFTQWCTHHKAFKRYRTLLQPKRSTETNLWIFTGNTGTGKSQAAHNIDNNAYWKPEGKWWDFYNNERTVILDDFSGDISYEYLLRLTDRYPLYVEHKGGFSQFTSTTIIITSNTTYTEWYPNRNYTPLIRRITYYYTCFEYFFTRTLF